MSIYETANNEPRILIVSASPLRLDRQSRFLDSYFHGFSYKKIAQFFSNPDKPTEGYCCSYFQITDFRLLMKRFRKSIEPGVVFSDHINTVADADRDAGINNEEKVNSVFKKIKRWNISRSIRKIVWKEKYWNNEKFNEWLDSFNPELIFFVISNETYLFDIAKYIQNKFNIPIIMYIADDYYFCHKYSISTLFFV